MVQGNYLGFRSKHQNIKIRKKFKKVDRYICCYPKTDNCNKVSRGYCCSWPQLYNRLDNKAYDNMVARKQSDDFAV